MRKSVILLVVCIFAASALAQGDLSDRLPAGAHEVAVAPDLNFFASLSYTELGWHGPTSDESWSTPLPLQGMVWQPGAGRHLAFMQGGGGVEEFQISSTDIWLFDYESGFRNLTQNAPYQGFAAEPIATAFNMDYYPVWDEDGTLYFFRSAYQPGDNWYERPIALYRLEDDIPVLVRELFRTAEPTPQMMPFPTYINAAFHGDRLAFVLVTDPTALSGDSGVWEYNLATDTLTKAAAEWCVGLPPWMDCYLLPETVEWANDALVVRLANRHPDRYYRELLPATYVYVENGLVMPLVDYSGAADGAPIEGLVLSGTVMDGRFVYADREGISVMNLPPDKQPPQRVATVEGFDLWQPPRLASGNDGGLLVVFGRLFRLPVQ